MNHWWYFVIGVLVYPIIRVLIVAINREIIEYRQKRLLKLVKITFPDNDSVTIIAVDTSDKRAMAKLERQLREEYDIPTTYQKSPKRIDGTDPSKPFRRLKDK